MLISNKKRYVQTPFDSEAEIEKVVVENASDIFGPSTLYFPKSLIKTSGGAATIPDGFAIDLSERRWFVVEAETSKHSVWGHIAPQVAKQVVAAAQPSTRKMLVDLAVKRAQQNPEVMEMFNDENIHQMDVRKVLDEIVSTKPIVGMPIDAVSTDLREWASTFKVDVKLWLVKKYVEFGNPKNIVYELPDEARPVLEKVAQSKDGDDDIAHYDASVADLIQAKLLSAGETLTMSYKRKNKKERRSYDGILGTDGSITVLGKTFTSPSYAAVYAIQEAGSDRKTVNGWTTWKTSQGIMLSQLREKFLAKK